MHSGFVYYPTKKATRIREPLFTLRRMRDSNSRVGRTHLTVFKTVPFSQTWVILHIKSYNVYYNIKFANHCQACFLKITAIYTRPPTRYHKGVHLKSSKTTWTGSETSQNKKLRISRRLEINANSQNHYRLRSRHR